MDGANERVNKVISKHLDGFKSGPRHRCEVTADRLGDDLTRYPDAFDGAARDAVALVRHILQDIAERERR
jgi:hypothetical protein